jgi:hypothetical protein
MNETIVYTPAPWKKWFASAAGVAFGAVIAVAVVIAIAVWWAREPNAVELPIMTLRSLEGQASLSGDYIFAEIYNRSTFTVSEIVVNVVLKEENGQEIWNRSYGLTPLSGTGAPLTSTTFSSKVGFTPSPKQKWEWSITSAKGRPTK